MSILNPQVALDGGDAVNYHLGVPFPAPEGPVIQIMCHPVVFESAYLETKFFNAEHGQPFVDSALTAIDSFESVSVLRSHSVLVPSGTHLIFEA